MTKPLSGLGWVGVLATDVHEERDAAAGEFDEQRPRGAASARDRQAQRCDVEKEHAVPEWRDGDDEGDGGCHRGHEGEFPAGQRAGEDEQGPQAARLRAVLADLRAHADPAGAEAAAAAAHDRRRLTVAGTFAGTVVLDGVLDPEGGATVLAALAPLAAPAVRMMAAPRPSGGPTPWSSWPGGRWTRRPCPAWAASGPTCRSGSTWPPCSPAPGPPRRTGPARSVPARRCGWPAMRRSARCSPPGRARCSIWVAASGWSARPSAGRWWSATAGVSSRTVSGHRRAPTPTTSGTGSTAAPSPAGARRLGAGPPPGRNLERDAAVGGASEPHRSRRRAQPRPVRGDPGAQAAVSRYLGETTSVSRLGCRCGSWRRR